MTARNAADVSPPLRACGQCCPQPRRCGKCAQTVHKSVDKIIKTPADARFDCVRLPFYFVHNFWNAGRAVCNVDETGTTLWINLAAAAT